MGLPQTVEQFLAGKGVSYKLVAHPHTSSSTESAEVAHIPGHRLAKAVMLEDDEGYLMAVVPAAKHLRLGTVHTLLGRSLGLATEPDLAQVFPDCEVGAVPPLGPAYGLQTLVDEGLLAEPEVFLEAGDHEHLLQISGEQFRSLMDKALSGQLSEPVRS